MYERVITLKPGQSVDGSVQLVGGTALSGQITGLDGKPLSYVNIMAEIDGSRDFIIGSVTGAEGKYEIRGIPAGAHKLELLRYTKRAGAG